MVNTEDQGKMPQPMAFHLGLHCLQKIKQSSRTEVHHNLEILTCVLMICTRNHPKFIVTNHMEEYFSIQRDSYMSAHVLLI